MRSAQSHDPNASAPRYCLTDAHSKKWENHQAMLGLFFAYYNFCRVHSTLTDGREAEGSPSSEDDASDGKRVDGSCLEREGVA